MGDRTRLAVLAERWWVTWWRDGDEVAEVRGDECTLGKHAPEDIAALLRVVEAVDTARRECRVFHENGHLCVRCSVLVVEALAPLLEEVTDE